MESVFTFDAESWADQEEISIVAWAEAPGSGFPSEAYQAAALDWPLITLPGDMDADGVADASDNCSLHHHYDRTDSDVLGVGGPGGGPGGNGVAQVISGIDGSGLYDVLPTSPAPNAFAATGR